MRQRGQEQLAGKDDGNAPRTKESDTRMSRTHTNRTRNPEIDKQLGEEEEQVAEEKNKLQRKKNKLTVKDRFRVRVTVYLSMITSRGLYIHQSHTQTTKPKAITETDQPGLFGLLLPTCQRYRDHDMLVVIKTSNSRT